MTGIFLPSGKPKQDQESFYRFQLLYMLSWKTMARLSEEPYLNDTTKQPHLKYLLQSFTSL